jgi:hypothetical protein
MPMLLRIPSHGATNNPTAPSLSLSVFLSPSFVSLSRPTAWSFCPAATTRLRSSFSVAATAMGTGRLHLGAMDGWHRKRELRYWAVSARDSHAFVTGGELKLPWRVSICRRSTIYTLFYFWFILLLRSKLAVHTDGYMKREITRAVVCWNLEKYE